MMKLVAGFIVILMTAIDIEAGFRPPQCDVFCLHWIQSCYCYGCCVGVGYNNGGYCYQGICTCRVIEAGYRPPQCDVFCLSDFATCYCYGCCVGVGYNRGGYCFQGICTCRESDPVTTVTTGT